MSNEQALDNLYRATRLARLTADEHEALRKCAEQLLLVAQAADKGQTDKSP